MFLLAHLFASIANVMHTLQLQLLSIVYRNKWFSVPKKSYKFNHSLFNRQTRYWLKWFDCSSISSSKNICIHSSALKVFQLKHFPESVTWNEQHFNLYIPMVCRLFDVAKPSTDFYIRCRYFIKPLRWILKYSVDVYRQFGQMSIIANGFHSSFSSMTMSVRLRGTSLMNFETELQFKNLRLNTWMKKKYIYYD